LSSKAGEAFWGGGQQNGQFAFQGKQLDISYSGGWEEGDRPNPAPVFISSQGYAVLRNTFAPGVYDFRQQNYLTASHQERGFDAYYMVGGLHDALRQYTALTGRVPLLPRWALEYGDADCYNDGDNRKNRVRFRLAGAMARPAPRRMWCSRSRRNTANTICRAAGFCRMTAMAAAIPDCRKP
jgi:alpha-glucosidase (family GH31 glycosyl hydrolase)